MMKIFNKEGRKRGINIFSCLPAFLIIIFATIAGASGKEEYDRAVLWRKFIESDSRPKIGLALGGGGARGMAHIGVLRSFQAAGIPVDMIAGTSIGSFVGALYATGAELDKIEKLALQTNWSNLIELKMSRVGFFSTRRLERFINFHLSFLQREILRLPSRDAAEEYLESDLADLEFRNLKIPFACTAADLYSGALVVFDTGPVAQAVRASCSIPGLFEPITIGNRVLVDGGVLLNLPVSLCRKLGASYVVAVDLESDTASPATGLVDVLAQIIKIQGNAITSRERERADIVVAPRVGGIKTTDLGSSAEAVREGERAGARRAAAVKDRILAGVFNVAARDEEHSSQLNAISILDLPPLQPATAYTAARSDLIPTARAAIEQGWDREALDILSRLPAHARNFESVYLEMLARIRLGAAVSSDAFERLEEFDPEDDLLWRLAAAALDRRMDVLADSITARIERRLASSER